MAGGRVRVLVAAIDDQVGLRVGRVTDHHQALQHVLRVATVQQRPVGTAGDAAQQRRQAGAQPHAHRFPADRGPRVGVHVGAATGRQHQRVAGQQTRDHPALAGAELDLAESVEDFRHRGARGCLDLGVGVAERQAESGGEAAADGGLSGAHQPDEDDAAPDQLIGQRLAVPEGGVACHGGGR
jgi:hypothetical protein